MGRVTSVKRTSGRLRARWLIQLGVVGFVAASLLLDPISGAVEPDTLAGLAAAVTWCAFAVFCGVRPGRASRVVGVVLAVASPLVSWWLTQVFPGPVDEAGFYWPTSAILAAAISVAWLIGNATRAIDFVSPAAVVLGTFLARSVNVPVADYLLDPIMLLSFGVGAGCIAYASRRQVELSAQLRAASERARVEAQLHDLIAHEVTGIVVLAQAARMATGQPEWQTIEDAGKQAMTHIRAIVTEQRDDGPVGDLGERLARVVEHFRPTVSAVVEGPNGLVATVSGRSARLAERVLTEALSNVRRHAPGASLVRVRVGFERGVIVLTVDNDGAGGPSSGGSTGTGLGRLASEITDVGGTFESGRNGDRFVVRAGVLGEVSR